MKHEATCAFVSSVDCDCLMQMCRNKLVRGIYKIEDLAKRLEGFIDPNSSTDWQGIRESLCAVPIDTTADGDLMSFVPPVSFFRSKGLLGTISYI